MPVFMRVLGVVQGQPNKITRWIKGTAETSSTNRRAWNQRWNRTIER
jgi:hypothetical protein